MTDRLIEEGENEKTSGERERETGSGERDDEDVG